MQGVFSAKLAILFLLDLFLLLLFIPGRCVIPSLAFRALERNYVSHLLLA
jgi:hypothetical protein